VNQSTIIFGYLAAAFVIFITMRGELPIYMGFLLSTPKQPSAGPTATGSGGISTGQAAAAVSAIGDIAPLVLL
jgi:hypothetical protein